MDLGDVGDLVALVGGVRAGRCLATAVSWICHHHAALRQRGDVKGGTPIAQDIRNSPISGGGGGDGSGGGFFLTSEDFGARFDKTFPSCVLFSLFLLL